MLVTTFVEQRKARMRQQDTVIAMKYDYELMLRNPHTKLLRASLRARAHAYRKFENGSRKAEVCQIV